MTEQSERTAGATTPRWTPSDLEAASTVLAMRRPGEAVHAITLTDEEVVILDGLERDQLVVLPWLSQQDADRALLGSVALRSLLARGMVWPVEPAPRSEDGIAIEAVPEITGTLVLRRSAGAILTAHRASSDAESWWYGYLHDGRTVLEEDVMESGHHTFGVYDLDLLTERLGPFLDPTTAARTDSAPRPVPRADLDALVASDPVFTEAVVATVLTSVRVDSDEAQVVTVYAGPHGVHALRAADPGDTSGTGPLTVTELGPEGLLALASSLLSGPPR
ncbi:hypothetical protein GCM10025865_24570 [Paraoerskovia sediminicola]|uniref:ESX secretion-associated protein EspG n=1 Tax=Paraoerskovia sediminicola TaxID=1138587 RepID=A0ABN6XGE8_9CELL|nr:hypothetical protein [Paraoerskovia sediminicola]BDZ43158.1 hypothetical protein GCM10025865_24570 [Paraoerskovia sediminicola]